MLHNLKPFFVLKPLVAVAAVLMAACGNDNSTQQSSTIGDQAVDVDQIINFKAMFGEEPYICGQTYSDVGAQSSDYTAKDFRLFASNIIAMLDDGTSQALNVVEDGVWQHDGVALLDFGHGCDAASDNPVNSKIEASLKLTASQVVSQICFDIGVPFELNHEDNTLQASPLNVSGMYWAWQSGHKFFRLDGVTSAGGFNVHLGSTGCDSGGKTEAPTTCANPNRPRICLALDPSTQTIIVDAKALLADSDVEQNTPNTAPGCMSGNNDPECPAVIPKFGLDFMYIPNSDDQTLIEADTQSVFYVE